MQFLCDTLAPAWHTFKLNNTHKYLYTKTKTFKCLIQNQNKKCKIYDMNKYKEMNKLWKEKVLKKGFLKLNRKSLEYVWRFNSNE